MKASILRLVLCRAGDVRLAMDAQQVRAARPYDPSQGRYPRFDELVFGARRPTGEETPFLIAFQANARVPGIVFSTLEEVVTVTSRDVQPLPSLVARFAGGYGLWGVVLLNEVPRFLFDPEGISAPVKSEYKDLENPDESDPPSEDRWIHDPRIEEYRRTLIADRKQDLKKMAERATGPLEGQMPAALSGDVKELLARFRLSGAEAVEPEG